MPGRECLSRTESGLERYAILDTCNKLHDWQTHHLTLYIKAPEIQQMYSLNMPVSVIRTKMRQEFERHRYVQQLPTVDVLLFNSHQEYQVCRVYSVSALEEENVRLRRVHHNRKPSTSGSSSLTSSSTSAQRRTQRQHYQKTSSRVSWRYVADFPMTASRANY